VANVTTFGWNCPRCAWRFVWVKTPPPPVDTRTEREKRIAAVNARFDALDEEYADSIRWNDRGQSGSLGDYERAAALAKIP